MHPTPPQQPKASETGLPCPAPRRRKGLADRLGSCPAASRLADTAVLSAGSASEPMSPVSSTASAPLSEDPLSRTSPRDIVQADYSVGFAQSAVLLGERSVLASSLGGAAVVGAPLHCRPTSAPSGGTACRGTSGGIGAAALSASGAGVETLEASASSCTLGASGCGTRTYAKVSMSRHASHLRGQVLCSRRLGVQCEELVVRRGSTGTGSSGQQQTGSLRE